MNSAPELQHAHGRVVVAASLDNLGSADVRFLQEAARRGAVHVRIPSDALLERATGSAPHFPAAERLFLAQALRCVASAEIVDRAVADVLPDLARHGDRLVLREGEGTAQLRDAAASRGLPVEVVGEGELAGFPPLDPTDPVVPGGPGRVVVTGCYDWFHSGHVRFFMDAAVYGELYVVVGSDRNVARLKGPGHPLQPEAERRYMVGAARAVHRCLISTGSGWMDAAPEIEHIRPTTYVVNEDGDQPEKREFCRANAIEYIVLKRVPQQGLPRRSSTDLRGF